MTPDEVEFRILQTGSVYGALRWTLAIFCAIHVYRNCKRIGETAWYNVTGTIILWPLYYILWILWWPGTLRRRLSGGSIDDLANAKAFQRLKRRNARLSEAEEHSS